MKKYRSIEWIIVFLIVIASPSITYSFLENYIDTSNHENRSVKEKPILTVENYETFPEEYESYYNDNLPYRNQLIRLNNSIDYFLFNQSSSDRVTIGKDGWLFYRDISDGNPIEQSLGYWQFSEEQLQEIATNLATTKRVLDSQGIEFVVFIAPNKETIYSEKIPDYYNVVNDKTATDQLVEYLNKHTDVRVVYPKEALIKAKKEYSDTILYHALDTHWNYAGAYIGTKCLAEELGKEMPELAGLTLEPVLSSRGDLTDMLNITIQDGDVDYEIDYSDINGLEAECETWDFYEEYIYHTQGADESNLVMRRDSFATAMAPIIATQFENSILIHETSFDQQQIFDYDADIFVLETVERHEGGWYGFKVSFINSSIEENNDGTKTISIAPAIKGYDLQYVTIVQEYDNRKEINNIQKLSAFNNLMKLEVNHDESGRIHIYIFGDENGEELIEETIIEF